MSFAPRHPRLCALVLVLAVFACGRVADRRVTAARAREWQSAQAAARRLGSERAQLAALRVRLAAAPVDSNGAPLGATAAALAAEVDLRERAIARASDALEQRLVRYIAGFALRADDPRPPALVAALHAKSDEDLAVGADWIARGGDYRRAIEIFELQLHADPGYPPLARALERARDSRFVTAERLGRLRPGMTQQEVVAALGPVNLRAVVTRPAERLQAWFYPKPGGRGAAVFFHHDTRRHAFVVYRVDVDVPLRQPPVGTRG